MQLTRVFWLSVLTLFLEISLIRWIGTEARIFAYLQNSILSVCFLALAVGCLKPDGELRPKRFLLPLLGLVALLSFPRSRYILQELPLYLANLGEFVIWFGVHAQGADTRFLTIAACALVFLLMWLTWNTFEPLGRLLGKAFDDGPDFLTRYSANICGALIGSTLFVLSSRLFFPPWAWIIFALCITTIIWSTRRDIRTILILGLPILAISIYGQYSAHELKTIWSPYQKLSVVESKKPHEPFEVRVNNVGYQAVLDLGKSAEFESGAQQPLLSYHDILPRLHPNPSKILIVGSGVGNDVMGALRAGPAHIHAVEIDPGIIQLSHDFSPSQPYQSNRVTLSINDARSFYETTDQVFDLIIFGLLDSHTTTSLMNSRLDSFVYTREGIAAARRRLAPHGVFVLSFETAAHSFLYSRIKRIIQEEFGSAPRVFKTPEAVGWGGTVFIADPSSTLASHLESNLELRSLIENGEREIMNTFGTGDPTISPTTDDWPYLYLPLRKVPPLVFIFCGLLLLLFLIKTASQSKELFSHQFRKLDLLMILLGAAFMLVQTQAVTRAAVTFGNTWEINAFVLSGIMVMALAANYIF